MATETIFRVLVHFLIAGDRQLQHAFDRGTGEYIHVPCLADEFF